MIGILSMCPYFISLGELLMNIVMSICQLDNLIFFWELTGSFLNSERRGQDADSVLTSNFV